MNEINNALCGNAIKCMELLHRLLGMWALLCLATAYLPTVENTLLKLPFVDVDVPVDSARWTCAVVIFIVGIVGCATLKKLQELSKHLEGTDSLIVVLTHPSIATLGAPWQRLLLGYGLAFVQYSVGVALWSPMPEMFGGRPDFGLAFLYSSSMFFFAWTLRDWNKNLKVNLPPNND
ncbi:hypothetical protein ACSZN8_06830 [Aeromonas caviae]|uniref:hypothetical protein n=1 Tax=Aeromonas caviae TaxID=648 RepID=UPI003EC702BD